MADTAALAQGAVEALLEDERLRGDLSDDGFGPLLDWATRALTAAAGEAARGTSEEAARARMAEVAEQVRGALAAAVQAAEGHSRDDLRALLREPLLQRSVPARLRVATLGLRLGDDPDANAARLARALGGLYPRAG